jgi:adenylate cyclase
LYDQAQDLCNRLGDTPQLFPILYGLTRARYNRAEHDLARGLGTRLLRVAEARPEPTLLVAAHTILGAIEVTVGRFEAAMPHLEKANALYDRSQHGDLVARFATDNGIVSGNFTTWALWCLGYPDRALKKGIENTSLAEELAHPLTLAMTYCFRAVAHQYRRENDAVGKWAAAAMAISSKHGFPQWLGLGRLLEGWAKGAEKYPHQHLQQMVEGLALWRSAGAEGFVPYALGLLAEAYEQENQQEEGLRMVESALEQIERTHERQWEAELHRIRGNLVLLTTSADAADQAETCFRRALDASRRQQAKSLELRAAVSLADLWRRQGKRAEAHDLLAPMLGWFTEGLDTTDLQDARVLLEELSPRDTGA